MHLAFMTSLQTELSCQKMSCHSLVMGDIPVETFFITAIARAVYLFQNMKSCYKNNTKNDYPMKHIVKMK